MGANTTGKKDDRARHYAAIVYPDSAPPDWRDALEEQHIAWAESPLHDADVDKDGKPKKPHWHILLTFDGNKSTEQVQEILAPLNCALPVKVNSLRGYVRYLAHLDNPEKHQYDANAIIAHGGFDFKDYLQAPPRVVDREKAFREIGEFIRTHEVYEFEDVFYYALAHEPDWFATIITSGSAYVITQLLDSRRGRKARHKTSIGRMYVDEGCTVVDKETGEVLYHREAGEKN